MRIRTLAGGLLAVGLLSVGCGGADTAVDEQSNLASQKDSLPICDGRYIARHYFSDATYTERIGGYTCFCNSSIPIVYGDLSSPYFREYELMACPYY